MIVKPKRPRKAGGKMWIRKAPELTNADITPKSVYLDRGRFLQAMGIIGATAAAGKGLLELAFPTQSAFAATKRTGFDQSSCRPAENPNNVHDSTHCNNF